MASSSTTALTLTPSDVAYGFQRMTCCRAAIPPAVAAGRPFFGVGVDDISGVVVNFACADDLQCMVAADP